MRKLKINLYTGVFAVICSLVTSINPAFANLPKDCDLIVAATKTVNGKPTITGSELAAKIAAAKDNNKDYITKVCLSDNLLVTAADSSWQVNIMLPKYAMTIDLWLFGNPNAPATIESPKSFYCPMTPIPPTGPGYPPVVTPTPTVGQVPCIPKIIDGGTAISANNTNIRSLRVSNLIFNLNNSNDVGIHAYLTWVPEISNVTFNMNGRESKGIKLYSAQIQSIKNSNFNLLAKDYGENSTAGGISSFIGLIGEITGSSFNVNGSAWAIDLSSSSLGKFVNSRFTGSGNFLKGYLFSIAQLGGDSQIIKHIDHTNNGRIFDLYSGNIGTLEKLNIAWLNMNPSQSTYYLSDITFSAVDLGIKSLTFSTYRFPSNTSLPGLTAANGSKIRFCDYFLRNNKNACAAIKYFGNSLSPSASGGYDDLF